MELAFPCVPEQVQWALAFGSFGPLVTAFASPVMTRRKRGIATTFAARLPRNGSVTEVGVRIVPMLPSAPPPGAPASSPAVRMSRSTGQKYVDRSPRRQVVPAAASEASVVLPSVDRFPT